MTGAKHTAALPLSFSRADGQNGMGTVRGAAVVWGDVAKLGRGRFALRERFQRGALKPYDRGVIATAQHNRAMLLAQYPNGGLRLDSSDRGLFVEIDLPDTSAGRDTRTLVEQGALRGLSIEFVDEKVIERDRDITIERAILTGVSIVDRPAYPKSQLEEIKRWLDESSQALPFKRTRRVWL